MIVLEDVSLDIAYSSVIKNVSFKIRGGEVVALVGPNGSGKSKILDLIMHFKKPTHGQIKILGKSIRDKDSHLALSFVNYLEDIDFKVIDETVSEFLNKFGLEQNLNDYHLFELAQRMDLKLKKKLSSLSIGEQQRLKITLCFANPGKILVLENPTAHLDPFIKEEVYSLIKEAQAKDSAILLTSNDLYEVEKICSRVIFMHEGKIMLDKTVDELLRKNHRIVRVTNTDHLIILNDMVLEGYDDTSYTYRYTGSLDKLLRYLSEFKIYSFTIEEVSLHQNLKRYCERFNCLI